VLSGLAPVRVADGAETGSGGPGFAFSTRRA